MALLLLNLSSSHHPCVSFTLTFTQALWEMQTLGQCGLSGRTRPAGEEENSLHFPPTSRAIKWNILPLGFQVVIN